MCTSRGLLVCLLALPAAAQTGFWSAPVPLTEVNTATNDYYPFLSADGVTLRWSSARQDLPGSPGAWDIYQAVRPDRFSPFGPVTREPGGINTPSNDLGVHVMPSEMQAFHTIVVGNSDIWETTRTGPAGPWGTPVLVAPLAGTGTDYGVTVTADGLYLMFSSGRSGAQDLYESFFVSGMWTPPVLVTPLSTTGGEYGPCLAPDGLTVWYSTAPSGSADQNVMVSRRKLTTDPWGPPVPVPELNSTFYEREPHVSDDGREVFFTSGRAGSLGAPDNWTARWTGLSHQNLPQPTRPLLIHLSIPSFPNANYQVGLALSSAPGFPVPGVGTVPLALDHLFLLSISGVLPGVFQNFSGVLDANGWATATLNLPPGPLVHLDFSVAAVTYGPGGISFITNGEDLKVNP
jgi:hypothetical protein